MRSLGPGFWVTAAFIGPGTVTTASMAGARFGLTLLWAVVFSILATMVLQEMSARLGVVSHRGLGEALRVGFPGKALSGVLVLGVGGALVLGNTAFEAGNLTGAALALGLLTGFAPQTLCLPLGLAVGLLLTWGAYRALERTLVILVAGMSLVFALTALSACPQLAPLLPHLLEPTLPQDSTPVVLALLGTTVVPYNLFLHSSAARVKWPPTRPKEKALREARYDTFFAVGLGGIITLAILLTAAAAFFARGPEPQNAATLAGQIQPLLGPAAQLLFALGLLAAGLSSALTAPLAAAYALAGIGGWGEDLKERRFCCTWAFVVLGGSLLAFLGKKPLSLILLAQAANGAFLPLLVFCLLILMNRRDLLGEHVNGTVANILGVLVVLMVSALGLFQISQTLGKA